MRVKQLIEGPALFLRASHLTYAIKAAMALPNGASLSWAILDVELERQEKSKRTRPKRAIKRGRHEAACKCTPLTHQTSAYPGPWLALQLKSSVSGMTTGPLTSFVPPHMFHVLIHHVF